MEEQLTDNLMLEIEEVKSSFCSEEKIELLQGEAVTCEYMGNGGEIEKEKMMSAGAIQSEISKVSIATRCN